MTNLADIGKRKGSKPPEIKVNRWWAVAIIVVLALTATTCSVASMGVTVEPGNVGVKVKTLGSGAGVQAEPLPARWHMRGIGERIVQYPVIQRTYSYTREADERGPENEEIVFADRTGLPMTADVAVILRVDPRAAARLYTKYRLSFDELLDGPIRNDVRSAIAAEAEQVAIDQLLAGGRQQVISRALGRVQRKWAADGVNISQLEWIGTIRFPDVIREAIEARTQAEQQTLAARARVAVAQAAAQERIETARGAAEANRLIAESLRTNPEVIQYRAIEKWDGRLPLATGGATPFISLPEAR